MMLSLYGCLSRWGSSSIILCNQWPYFSVSLKTLLPNHIRLEVKTLISVQILPSIQARDNLLANCAKLHFITILNSYLFLLNNWKDKKTNQSDAFVDVFLDSKISNAVNVCPKTITVTNVEKMNCRFLWICKLPCITSPETKLHISGKINNWFAIRSCIWLCTSVRTAHDVITSHHLHYG